MKRIIYGVLTAVVMASMVTGCGSKPTEEETRAAIESGTLTIEDALERGYVDEAWVEAYKESVTVPAADKFSANPFGSFVAQDVHGEDFTFTAGETPTLFVFANPETEDSITKLQDLESVYEALKSAGGDAVVVLKGDTLPDTLADYTVPAVFYTDELKEQLGSLQEMVEDVDFTTSWNMRGAFISAWSMGLEAEELADTATSFLEAFAEPNSDSTSVSDSAPGTMIAGKVE